MRKLLQRNWRLQNIHFLETLSRRQFWSTGSLATGLARAPTPTPAPPLDPTQLRLRPYQEETIQALLDYVKTGGRRAGVSLATGSGKTVIFTHLIARVPSRNEKATQTLILAHRQELVLQAYDHCKRVYPHKSVDIELGNEHASGAADITLASVQSITSKDRLQKFDASRFKLIIVDEAHHIVAPTYLRILEHFNLKECRDDSPVLAGFSATLSRHDGLAIGKALDHIVYHKDYIEMINDEWLAALKFTTVRMMADLSKVKSNSQSAGGDFQTAALSQVMNTPENNETAFLAWKERIANRQSTLIFCVDVQHIRDMTATFQRHGVDARFVTGATPPKSRSEILDAFKNREFPVLLNCGVFTEGTDVPNIDCVLLTRPTRSRSLLVQMIGRGIRLYPGKENCLIIDLISSRKVGIVTTPTLFGLDPDLIVNAASSHDLKLLKQQKTVELETAQEVASASRRADGIMALADYDSIHDFLDDSRVGQHIRELSTYAWVQVDSNRHILLASFGNKTYLTIKAQDDIPKKNNDINDNNNEDSDGDDDDDTSATEYIVTYTIALPQPTQQLQPTKTKSPYMRPRTIATATTFHAAVRAADTFAKQIFPHRFIARNQEWRQAPASDKQLALLNKSRPEDRQLLARHVSKGQAIDMVVKLKFGAKGWFGRAVAGKKKKRLLNEGRGAR